MFVANPVAETRNNQLGIFATYFTEQRLIDMTNIIECVTNNFLKKLLTMAVYHRGRGRMQSRYSH